MYCAPLSEWWITPSGRRRESAIASAASTSSVRMCVAMAQPTTRRLQTSSTMARYSQPAQVGTYVMSATHSSSGPEAEKSRLTMSGAGRAPASPRVVAVLQRLRVTPWIPSPPISRPTRFWPTRSPSALSAAWIRGRPYVSPLSVQIAPIRSSRSSSRRARRDGGRFSQS